MRTIGRTIGGNSDADHRADDRRRNETSPRDGPHRSQPFAARANRRAGHAAASLISPPRVWVAGPTAPPCPVTFLIKPGEGL